MDQIEFGTDGIRQKAGQWPIDVIGAQKVGLGVGRYLHEKYSSPKIVIGRDTRISGDMLCGAINSGLLSYGVDVLDVGVITTPGVAYLTRAKNAEMGIIISASHNHWTENGIKLIGSDGFKLPDDVEQVIERYVNEALCSDMSECGRLLHNDAWTDEYIEHLITPFKKLDFSKLSVVLDCANGAASNIAPCCFELLGSKTIILNNNPSGTNINLDSGSEVVRGGRGMLIPTVTKENCHFGVAYDGDADRAIFVDELGKLVDGDNAIFIIASHLKKKGALHGDAVVTTEMANLGLENALTPIEIKTHYTKVGDKYVVSKMRQEGFVVGGEQSGHIIILDDEHTTGDGIYTSLYLASILLQSPDLSLHTVSSTLVKLPQVIASARVTQKKPLEEIVAFVTERDRIKNLLGKDAILNTRYSGTEPMLRVMIQASVDNSLSDLAQHAIKLCQIVQTATNPAENWIEVKDCTTGEVIKY